MLLWNTLVYYSNFEKMLLRLLSFSRHTNLHLKWMHLKKIGAKGGRRPLQFHFWVVVLLPRDGLGFPRSILPISAKFRLIKFIFHYLIGLFLTKINRMGLILANIAHHYTTIAICGLLCTWILWLARHFGCWGPCARGDIVFNSKAFLDEGFEVSL